MTRSKYPQSAHHPFPGPSIPIYPIRVVNRRRRRWPAILLAFILGLLAGWALCGGGAWLP